jgi:hypothetical protein
MIDLCSGWIVYEGVPAGWDALLRNEIGREPSGFEQSDGRRRWPDDQQRASDLDHSSMYLDEHTEGPRVHARHSREIQHDLTRSIVNRVVQASLHA